MKLHPEQREDVLARLAIWQSGTRNSWLLAHSTGYGKSYTSLAAVESQRRKLGDPRPVLIISEISGFKGWREYGANMGLNMLVVDVVTPNGERQARNLTNEYFVINPDRIPALYELLVGRKFFAIIVDEISRYFANPNTSRSRALLGLDADYRIGLDATVVLRYPDRLWPILNQLEPGDFAPDSSVSGYRTRKIGRWGSLDTFTGKPYKVDKKWHSPDFGFCTYAQGPAGWFVKGYRNLPQLHAALKGLITYRPRPDSIPKPTVKWIPVTPNPTQAKLYALALEHRNAEVVSGNLEGGNQIAILAALHKERAICALPPSFFLDEKPDDCPDIDFTMGTKQRWLKDVFLPHLRPNDRAIIFCDWKRGTRDAFKLCKNLGFEAAQFEGGMSRKKRDKVLQAWDSGLIQVLIGTPAMYNSINAHKPVDKGDYLFTVMLDVVQWSKISQRIGRTVRDGLKGTPIVLIPYVKDSIEPLWARFGRSIVESFEKIIGPNPIKSEVYSPWQ